jgi:hypothetical protein
MLTPPVREESSTWTSLNRRNLEKAPAYAESDQRSCSVLITCPGLWTQPKPTSGGASDRTHV